MKLPVILMTLMLALTGCSSPPPISAPKLVENNIVHPPIPKPVRLIDEKWKVSSDGKTVSMPVTEAKKVVDNKIKVGQWMKEASNVIKYYRERFPDPQLQKKKQE